MELSSFLISSRTLGVSASAIIIHPKELADGYIAEWLEYRKLFYRSHIAFRIATRMGQVEGQAKAEAACEFSLKGLSEIDDMIVEAGLSQEEWDDIKKKTLEHLTLVLNG